MSHAAAPEIIRDPRIAVAGKLIVAELRRERGLQELYELEPHPIVFLPAPAFVERWSDEFEEEYAATAR